MRCAVRSGRPEAGRGDARDLFIVRRLRVLVACVLLACAQNEGARPKEGDRWPPEPIFPQGGLVAHAMGAVDGKTYTNSAAAFRRNYAAGRRWFEVDFSLTRDGAVYAFHEGHERHLGLDQPVRKLGSERLRGMAYLGTYPLLSLEQVIELFASSKDAYLVTDTKRWTPELAKIFASHLAHHPDLVARVVPQLYRTDDFEVVTRPAREAGFDYRALIFTLYQNRLSDEEVAEFVEQRRIPIVVVHTSRFSPWTAELFHSVGAKVVVHTVNRHEDVLEFGLAGADGFYTDYYLPYVDALSTARTSPMGAEARQSARWSKFDLTRPGDFRLSKCVQKVGRLWVAKGCAGGSVIDGPRRPAPKGASVRSHVAIRGKAFGLQARLRIASRGGRKEHYSSGWQPVPLGERLSMETSVEMEASVADVKLQLYVREPHAATVASAEVAVSNGAELIVEGAALEIVLEPSATRNE